MEGYLSQALIRSKQRCISSSDWDANPKGWRERVADAVAIKDGKINDMKEEIVGLNGQITDWESKWDEKINSITSNDAALAEMKRQRDEAKVSRDDFKGKNAKCQTDLSAKDTDFKALEGRYDQKVIDWTSVNDTLVVRTRELTDKTKDYKDKEAELKAMTSDRDAQKGLYDEAKGDLQTKTERVNVLTTDLKTKTDEFGVLEGEALDLRSNLSKCHATVCALDFFSNAEREECLAAAYQGDATTFLKEALGQMNAALRTERDSLKAELASLRG
jgi:chromosome segregation ATPase